LTSMIFHATI